MKGGVSEYTPQEQSFREWVAAQKAEFAFKQKIEKQRWEQDILLPRIAEYQAALAAGESVPVLELPDAS